MSLFLGDSFGYRKFLLLIIIFLAFYFVAYQILFDLIKFIDLFVETNFCLISYKSVVINGVLSQTVLLRVKNAFSFDTDTVLEHISVFWFVLQLYCAQNSFETNPFDELFPSVKALYGFNWTLVEFVHLSVLKKHHPHCSLYFESNSLLLIF